MLTIVILSVLDTDNQTRQWGGNRTRNRKTGCPTHTVAGVPGTGGGMLYYRGPVQTSRIWLDLEILFQDHLAGSESENEEEKTRRQRDPFWKSLGIQCYEKAQTLDFLVCLSPLAASSPLG